MASSAENSIRPTRNATRRSGTDRAPLHDATLGRFYAGEPIPCPVGCGGNADVVRVGTSESGGGELWLECTSCAQRRRYDVPRAALAEKLTVSSALRARRTTCCPRHATPVALTPRGRQLVCPACGVVFRD